MKQVRKMLRIFLTDDALSSKVPQLTLRIAEGDCIVKFQFVWTPNNTLTNCNGYFVGKEYIWIDKLEFDEGECDMNNIVVEWYEDKKNVDEMQNWYLALKEWEQSVIKFFSFGC